MGPSTEEVNKRNIQSLKTLNLQNWKPWKLKNNLSPHPYLCTLLKLSYSPSTSPWVLCSGFLIISSHPFHLAATQHSPFIAGKREKQNYYGIAFGGEHFFSSPLFLTAATLTFLHFGLCPLACKKRRGKEEQRESKKMQQTLWCDKRVSGRERERMSVGGEPRPT